LRLAMMMLKSHGTALRMTLHATLGESRPW
jgi:hypothetical protein